jgi:hypothetical protein
MQRERYFVRRLADNERPRDGSMFEVQVLNNSGQAIECGYIHPEDTTLIIGDRAIPEAVLAAAKLRELGDGQYVDRDGNVLNPF